MGARVDHRSADLLSAALAKGAAALYIWRMRYRFRSAITALCLCAPLPVSAHPHVFIDTGLTLVTDATGQLLGIEVSWTYDDLYSMLLFEDMGVDQDFDGRLSDREITRLDGFDMQWVPGFEGDLFVTMGENTVRLGAPEPRGTSVADARITTRHYRPLNAPVPVTDVAVRAYDPTYYTAYELTQGVALEGGVACSVAVVPADLDRAYTMVEEMLYAQPADQMENNFPEVGEAFADTVTVTCDT